MLAILSGTSGVGKNTIINCILNDYHDKYLLLPTYTTREMRPFEKQGEPYFFISECQFKRKLLEDDFYEHEVVHGHYYGTSRKLLLEKKSQGKILIKDIDVKGTQNLVKQASCDIRIITFFLYVQSKKELRNRLESRGEKDIELRLSRYELEMKYANKYTYLIDNEDKEYTVCVINSLIDNEYKEALLVPTHDVQEKQVNYYIEILRSGKQVDEYIDIIWSNNKWFILHGHSLYLASLATGISVTKRVINNNKEIPKELSEQYCPVWYRYLEKLDSNGRS